MTIPHFPETSSSLARKHLSAAVFKALKTKKTAMGFSLEQALNSGMVNADSTIGIYAGDAECYTLFAPLLLPIIQEYHGFSPDDFHETDRSQATLTNPDPHHRYILSTRIRVARNLAGYAFTPLINKAERTVVEKTCCDTFDALPAPLAGRYMSMALETDIVTAKSDHPAESIHREKNRTIQPSLDAQPREAFLFSKGDRFQEAAGINRDWPHARGCFVSRDTRFRVWLNEEDHLRIISMDTHGDMAATFNRLAQALTQLEKSLVFARDPRLGYLAACPSNIGTGMRAGVHIRLPRLFTQQDQLDTAARQLRLQVRGTRGEKTAVEQAVFDISNEQRLGITEKECIETLHKGLCRLIEMEEALECRA